MKNKMEQEYKHILYKNYLSTHNVFLHGHIDLQSISKKFTAWDLYYKKHLPVRKESMILDIGCGEGAFVYYLQSRGYSQVHGIDISEEQISLGRELGILNLQVADLTSYLNGTESRFDLIIARDVIEHFTKQEAFDVVSLISKALRSDGKFIMQVPNGQGLFCNSIFYGDFTHEMAYSSTSVRQLFLNSGFTASICFPTGPIPHSVMGRLRQFIWGLKVLQLRFWKLIETGNGSGIFTSNIIAVGKKACE
jgi:2-polyprenyl-3-methyl-5-hydroxy-6-metoxy-1,4-benzoquinol methylase